jgi:hypothetical protein
MFMELQNYHVQLRQKHGLEPMETKVLFSIPTIIWCINTNMYILYVCINVHMYT